MNYKYRDFTYVETIREIVLQTKSAQIHKVPKHCRGKIISYGYYSDDRFPHYDIEFHLEDTKIEMFVFENEMESLFYIIK